MGAAERTRRLVVAAALAILAIVPLFVVGVITSRMRQGGTIVLFVALAFTAGILSLTFVELRGALRKSRLQDYFWRRADSMMRGNNRQVGLAVRFFAEYLTYPYEQRAIRRTVCPLSAYMLAARDESIPKDLKDVFRDLLISELWLDVRLNPHNGITGLTEEGEKGCRRSIRQFASPSPACLEFLSIVAAMDQQGYAQPMVKELQEILLQAQNEEKQPPV